MKLLNLILMSSAALLIACADKDKNFSSTQSNQQCETKEVNGQVEIRCPNGINYAFQAPVDGIDGQDGLDGLNGTNGMDAQGITVADPCGDNLNQVDEVLLFFPDNTVIAWYLGVGMVVLTPNVMYQTTDNQHCKFSVDQHGLLTEYP